MQKKLLTFFTQSDKSETFDWPEWKKIKYFD